MTPSEARERIRAHADLNAFISLTDEEGDGPVVAVKDLVDVRGTVTTAGASFLPNSPADRDAPLVRRIREVGCVVVGTAILQEGAVGASGQTPLSGGVERRGPPRGARGGPRGGSAPAVAGAPWDCAVGRHTGGPIQIPASFCGVVGFKPPIGPVDTE